MQLITADINGKISNILNVQLEDKKQRSESIWNGFMKKKTSATSTDEFYGYLQKLIKMNYRLVFDQ